MPMIVLPRRDRNGWAAHKSGEGLRCGTGGWALLAGDRTNRSGVAAIVRLLAGFRRSLSDVPLPHARHSRRETGCHPPPDSADLAAMVLNVPPMQGAEYLSESSLVGIWQDLDAWVRGEIVRRRRALGLPEAAGAAVASGGPGVLSPGRESARRTPSVCLPGDLCSWPGRRWPRPVSAAEPRAARTGRSKEQDRRSSICSRRSNWLPSTARW